ncbi:NAD(P)-binding protein [Thermosediminibacter oceani]|uniref:FAD-dependent pyridine nucleotide-disulfide oxidoreductase n=1 Tax=Thermosediminibacter oceani (strain ATCC BAA-1034 / DSM 16646 / JW/IW-1228P) TaxID=555079 RepID=D9S0A1_THEOJ|nr:NAD(P)-binding protein [Thermosediminibacter oceani]ADL07029.1 FAD-dependent pyridine nucleotide-disulfide oxidoreductase [Thermosediminibacter oceani DSM 16646]
MEEIRLNINGREVRGLKGQTILEVARENGIDIPTLCYDERVKIYGSCGLCLVEVEGAPKLLRACATEISNGMVVYTDTKKVRASRKVALELLLSNHTGDCRPPCRQACPARTDCQGYVGLIANGQYREAVKLIKEQLPLPASIGRICPHPCEDACRRQLVEEPIAIAWLKSFVGDVDLASEYPYMPEIKPPTGKSVSVIGSGPAGLSAAYYLAKEGHRVVVYEAMEKPGGMLRYGIPQYRLPKEVLDREIDLIRKMGVEFITGCRVGRDVTLDYLRSSYDAVFVAIGAWKSAKVGCPGEDLDGVLGGIDFLRAVAKGEPVNMGRRVAVVGGGNTAMDACRTAIRLGAEEVYVLYRRTRNEMPANEVEIKEAEEEGVKFVFLVSPIEIMGRDGRVAAVRLQKMRLGEPDSTGRRKPEPIPGEEMILEVDTVIAAIGQEVNPEGLEGLNLTRKRTISADEGTFATSIPGVFAGGDAINEGPGIAIEAVADGKKAAEVIMSYLEGNTIPFREPYVVRRSDLTQADFADRERIPRVPMPHLSPEERKTNFREFVLGYSEEEAKKEAMRCLECGCKDFFECKLIKYANEYGVNPEKLAGEVSRYEYRDDHPFIVRDPNKCILCGLCVRVCDEVMGITALGFVNRGFDTVIKPEFELPLRDTSCISCGQCVAVCPTGALQEKPPVAKPVPVATEKKHTVCSFCGVGCNMKLDIRGDMILRALPDKESPVDAGHLCVKGRFGFSALKAGERLTTPLVRENGKLAETSWEEALLYAGRKVQGIRAMNGGESLAVFVSPRLTNEEIFMAVEFAKKGLGTPHVASFSNTTSGLKDVLGFDASTNSLEELTSTDMILLIGCRVMEDYAVAGLKIREALKEGAKLVVINPEPSIADEWAHKVVRPENSVDFLKALLKGLIEEGFTSGAARAEGFEELKASLADTAVSDDIREIARLYGKAGNAMVVFDHERLTRDAERLIASIAVVSGHIGRPRNGIVMLKAKGNAQGLVDMGVTADAAEILKLIEQGRIKGAFIFGEDPAGADAAVTGILKKLEFLAVQDLFLTDTARLADVVLPAAAFSESRGSYTSAERRVQWFERALPASTGRENWQVIRDLAGATGCAFNFGSAEEVLDAISRQIPEYRGVKKTALTGGGIFWPAGTKDAFGMPVLYREGFNFESGKARLAVSAGGPAFRCMGPADAVERAFARKMEETGIAR